MVGEDVDFGDGEVGGVDAVGAVDDELVWGQGLYEGGDFGCPAVGDPFVAEDGTAELVAGFVGEYCWVFGLGCVVRWVFNCSLGVVGTGRRKELILDIPILKTSKCAKSEAGFRGLTYVNPVY